MARIVYPDDFPNQVLLLRSVAERYDSLPPADNPLTAYLAQHDIDLADDGVAADGAIAFDRTRKERAGEAENHTQKRNLAFDPAWAKVRSYYQFLKKFYSPNFMELKLWGAPITTTGRVAYPKEFLERAAIYGHLREKYESYAPGTGPLDAYLTLHGQTMAANTAAVNSALALHQQAKAAAGQAEDATQDRNNLWSPVIGHLRSIGGFLMSLYTHNPKELNLWGYTVDDSPRAPKEMVSKVKLGSQLTVTKLIIGGTLRNIGTVPLIVYKGTDTTGNGVVVLPGEAHGITKGGSASTVVNSSDTTTGVFSALRHR